MTYPGEIWLDKYDLEEEDLNVDPYVFAKQQGIGSSLEIETVVVDTKGNVLGVLFISPTQDTFSFDVAVDSNYRGKGLGSRLVDQAIDISKEYSDVFPEMKIFVQVVSQDMERILSRKGFEIEWTTSQGSTYMSRKIEEAMFKRKTHLDLLETLGYKGSTFLFEEDEEDLDDIFADDTEDTDDEEDLFGDDEEVEEEDEEVEEEEEEPVEPPSAEELADELGADAVGDAIADAIQSALQTGLSANVLGENLATELRRLYEEEGMKAELPPIDIATYAKEIANLIRNYTTLLDVPGMIYSRSRDYVAKNYGEDWAEAFDEAMSIMKLNVPVGGDERGPLTTRPVSSNGEANPMLGPLSIGTSGDGGGGI